MRRQEREIADRAAVEALLRSCPVGHLATVGAGGWPVVKPVNFVYADGALYLHTAREGEKVDDLRRDDRVCFEVDQPVAYLRAPPDGDACRASYLYRSALAWGRARWVEDPAEKRRALGWLMDKYQGGEPWGQLPEAALAAVGVVRIDVERMTGKENLGRGPVWEAAAQALARGEALPLTLEPAPE
ncbi:MAG: pyridoxamine 5'-phosphate oxidase family protein [Deferrisomatales bacterium]